MIGLSFAIIRLLFPVQPVDGEEAPFTKQERRIYSFCECGAVLLFFLFAPLLGFAWYFALGEADGLLHPINPGTRFLVRTMPIFWGIPAIFLGIITSAIPMEWLYHTLLQDRYRRYERFCDARVGFDGRRLLAWLAAMVAVGSSIGLLAGVTSYARFDEAGVEIGRPLRFRGTFYEYTRVRSIEHRATFRAPNGMTVRRPHYVVVFDDGTAWSTREGFRDPDPEPDGRIAQFVAQRGGRPIVERP